jgi:hypothetical protein
LVSEPTGANKFEDVAKKRLLRLKTSYATENEGKYVLKIFVSYALQEIFVGKQTNEVKMDTNVISIQIWEICKKS